MKKRETQELFLPIGKKEIADAKATLMRYKRDKINLEKKTVENEQWWKLRHWEHMSQKGKGGYKPASAWLWNVIVSKHADTMDAFPEPNLLPRAEDDRNEAKRLSAIIPIILSQNEFERVYSDVQWYKLKQGTGVYGVFWDSSKNNGIGDISIKKVDLLSLYWEGGVSDIQNSRNVFYVSLEDNDLLISKYPQLEGKLGRENNDTAKYRYDDNVDTTHKTPVIDWYYKKAVGGRTVLHYCRFTGDTVLFASENEGESYHNGWYDHALYPFVFDTLFSIEGSACGYGYIDIGKSAQEQIDMLNEAIINNAMMSARPRYFIRNDGSVNEEEFADWSRDFVHTNSNLGNDSIQPITVNPLNGIFVTLLNNKIDELKETSGNRDAANGGSASGVTAASAIAAMQEAGSKISRDSTKGAYSAYKQVISQCIELIRQFYGLPRYFRMTGELGDIRFEPYTNEGLRPTLGKELFGVSRAYRVPAFDIDVSAQKASPYSKMSQNELAMQFYNLGFFDPAKADMALACLDMMDFSKKESVMRMISENAQRHNVMQMGAQAAEKNFNYGEPALLKEARKRVAEGHIPV